MNNSYELLLDTCNDFCYLALINKKQKIEEIKLKVNKNITDLINKAITNLVKKAKIKFSHITDIYVNIGPGSFTGEKVGIIICKA